MNDDDDNDDYYGIDWNFMAPLIQSAAGARNKQVKAATKKPKAIKAPKSIKKADNLHVHQDQDYFDTLSGVTRIALVAVSELVNQGKADFLFLRDDEVKSFWDKHLAKIVIIREAKEKLQREHEMRVAALAKLTPEEKKLLGIR